MNPLRGLQTVFILFYYYNSETSTRFKSFLLSLLKFSGNLFLKRVLFRVQPFTDKIP